MCFCFLKLFIPCIFNSTSTNVTYVCVHEPKVLKRGTETCLLTPASSLANIQTLDQLDPHIIHESAVSRPTGG